MAWIELHQTLPKNKKILRLKRILKIKTPQAIGHVCLLWLWALDNAPDGDLSGFSADDIAEICEFTKNSQLFLESLIEAGFVDDNLRIHDWDEYIGRLLEKRAVKKEQARLRQQRYRERMKNENSNFDDDDSKENNSDVTRDNSVSNAHNTTLHYTTVQYHSGECGEMRAPVRGEEPLRDTPLDLRSIVDELFKRWSLAPLEQDYAIVQHLVESLHPGESSFGKDDVDLLKVAFDAALTAGKKNLSYVGGVFKNFRKRKIKTLADCKRYEARRNEKAAQRQSSPKPGASYDLAEFERRSIANSPTYTRKEEE